jgi:serine/threonine protein kinase
MSHFVRGFSVAFDTLESSAISFPAVARALSLSRRLRTPFFPLLAIHDRSRFFFCAYLGSLRRIAKLRPWNLRSVLTQKYDYPVVQADKLRDFLIPMLALDPAERPSAGELAKHPWLDDRDAAPPYAKNLLMEKGLDLTTRMNNAGRPGCPDGTLVDDEKLIQVLQSIKALELEEERQAAGATTTAPPLRH